MSRFIAKKLDDSAWHRAKIPPGSAEKPLAILTEAR
jgi:hypothetical protein